ncbi:MAG: hypothetical protein ACPGU7_10650 [Gammaproteobacteria bacterium]
MLSIRLPGVSGGLGWALVLTLISQPLAVAQLLPSDRGQDFLVVSLGDSYAAGEGNPDIEASEPAGVRWLDGADATECHRSLRNAHRAAFTMVARRAKAANPGVRPRFLSLACGGAGVVRGLLRPQFAEQAPVDGNCSPGPRGLTACNTGQIERLQRWAASRRLRTGAIDVLLISIGGNDVLLGDAVKEFTSVRGIALDIPSRVLMANVRNQMRALPHRLGEALTLINSTLRPRRIVLVEYPDPLRGPDGRFCHRYTDPAPVRDSGLLMWDPVNMTRQVSRDENAWAYSQVLLPLNRTLRTVAAKFPNVTVVGGIERGMVTRGYCASPGQRYFHTFTDSFNVQGGFIRHFPSLVAGLHPNDRGVAFISQAIARHVFSITGL